MNRLKAEMALVRERYGKWDLSPTGEFVRFESWPLPSGWNAEATRLLIRIPAGYPTATLDNFYTDPELRLASGSQPGNWSDAGEMFGERWAQFSYHVQNWKAAAEPEAGHNLQTFLLAVEERLREAN